LNSLPPQFHADGWPGVHVRYAAPVLAWLQPVAQSQLNAVTVAVVGRWQSGHVLADYVCRQWSLAAQYARLQPVFLDWRTRHCSMLCMPGWLAAAWLPVVRARIGVVLHSVLLAYAWVAACITDIITRLVPSAFGLLVLSCCIAIPCLCGSPPGFGPLA
jgi:hypothetical protein